MPSQHSQRRDAAESGVYSPPHVDQEVDLQLFEGELAVDGAQGGRVGQADGDHRLGGLGAPAVVGVLLRKHRGQRPGRRIVRHRTLCRQPAGRHRSSQVRSGQVRSGQARSGQVTSGHVRSGRVRSGQVLMVTSGDVGDESGQV